MGNDMGELFSDNIIFGMALSTVKFIHMGRCHLSTYRELGYIVNFVSKYCLMLVSGGLFACQGFPELTKSCIYFPNMILTSADLKLGCKGNNGKNCLLNPGTSSQNEGYGSKWLIWLVCLHV